MKKVLKILLLVVVLGAIGGTMFFLYQKSKKKPVVYEIKSPFISNVVKKTVATGSVVPRKEIDIKPQVSGIVEEIFIEAGNRVKKGDLIARVTIIPNMVELNNAESRLNKAKINFEDSKLVYERQKKVYEQGVIPEAEFQQFRLSYMNALEEQETAEANLQLIKEGVSKKSGAATNTLIRSTIEGMVLDVPVEVGNSVIESNTFNEGTTIASVADMGEMIFEGKVDETEVGKLRLGMPLILSIGAIEEEKFDAELEYISPKGKEENGAIQFEIKADVKLKNNSFIRAGYSANADIVLDRKDSVMVIPESLIKFEREGDSAYVEIETQPQIFEKRYIKTGLSDGVNIEVKDGIIISDKLKGQQKQEEEKKKAEEESSQG
ncbi:MAG: efflux RND transporter periplasmic adaptor subunit [Alphaproteobacteria bacterium]|nr:MAG: efflux RND transporter periplasmic adaptor subunit [Alphaproteobacteria bacterium]